MAAEPRKRVSERPNEKKEEDSHGKPGKKRVKFDDAVTELCETARLLSDGTKSVRDVILQQNAADKQLLMKTVAEHRTTKEFRTACSERLHGQWQWGMCSHNIRHPGYLCKHACAYCYIGPMFKRFGRVCQPVDMEDPMPVDKDKVENVSPYGRAVAKPSDRKMVFFPSSSDIFVENAADYVRACKKIIDAGHEIMYVTKAPSDAVQTVVAEIEKLKNPERYKRAFFAFVTLTSTDAEKLRDFEPNAPPLEERLDAIRHLAAHGFCVNAMAEPYLSDPLAIADRALAVLPPAGIVAIGKMNYQSNIEFFPGNPTKNAAAIKYLDELYNRENTMRLFDAVKANPRLFLKKDSVDAVLKYACHR